ncbi:hypothetical protein ASD86_24320 [Lysobacter sp. Root690]|nr:hypothetical protein ASD86_24320 [Lysobacter sp. Root690]
MTADMLMTQFFIACTDNLCLGYPLAVAAVHALAAMLAAFFAPAIGWVRFQAIGICSCITEP